MTLSTLLCCMTASDTYGWVGAWEYHEELNGVQYGVRVIDGRTVIAFEGSHAVSDWLRDFEALPIWYPDLGFVHAGFAIGIADVFKAVTAKYPGPYTVVGHSLGGARARLFAAYCVANNIAIDTVCVFGSPKPGFNNYARLLQKGVSDHRSYRNRNDPVPLVPIAFPLLPWVHSEEWVAVDAAPSATDFEDVRDHAINLYVIGCKDL